MRSPLMVCGVGWLVILMLAYPLPGGADAKKPAGSLASGTSARVPNVSGLWGPDPAGVHVTSWDPADSVGQHRESLPMYPWARAKTRAAHPPFGANQTFKDINDPVQKYCDPPGVSRMYMYPYEFSIVQAPGVVYLMYEYFKVWRIVPLNQPHTSDPDPTWYGESRGRYEGDTLVIDTRGFNDKTWLDHVGHPHSEALHLIERFRRVDHNTLELVLTIEDPKAYPKAFTGRKLFKLSDSPMGEAVCSVSESQEFENKVINPTTTPVRER